MPAATMEGRHGGTHKEIEAKKAAKKAARAAKAAKDEAAAPALVVEKGARKREPEAEAPPSDAATAKAAKRAKKAAKAAAKAEAPVVAQAAAASDDDQPMKIHKKEAPPASAPEDIRLACVDCNQEFLFTVGEQEFFKQKVPLKPCPTPNGSKATATSPNANPAPDRTGLQLCEDAVQSVCRRQEGALRRGQGRQGRRHGRWQGEWRGWVVGGTDQMLQLRRCAG